MVLGPLLAPYEPTDLDEPLNYTCAHVTGLLEPLGALLGPWTDAEAHTAQKAQFKPAKGNLERMAHERVRPVSCTGSACLT